METQLAPIPAHVPPSVVRDIDIFAIQEIDRDIHRAWRKLQDESPSLVWSPRHGGHWIPMRAHVVEEVISNADVFTNAGKWVPANPPEMFPLLPIQSDGDLHRGYRAFIMPYVIGRPLLNAVKGARQLAIDLIEGFKPKGECDFAKDFAQHLPISVFLSLVDLPMSDRPFLAGLAEVVREPDPQARMAAFGQMIAYLNTVIEERTANPGEDVISRIIHGEVMGRRMTPTEIIGECTQLMVGGLDTVASMMGFIAAHLAVNVELRRKLAAHPELIEKRVDEIIRRFGVAAPAREALKDIEFDGVTIKAGDPVYVATLLHGLDDQRWDDPMTIDLDRNEPGTAFQTFGSGPHRCPGAALARSEIILFLEEWLKRIPEYELNPEKPMIAASGSVTGCLSLPLRWKV